MYGSRHYGKRPSRINHAAILTFPQYHSFCSYVHVSVMFPHRRWAVQPCRCSNKVMGWKTAETGFDSQRNRSFLCLPIIPNRPWDPLGLLSNVYRGYSGLGVELTTHNYLVPLVKKDGPCTCSYLGYSWLGTGSINFLKTKRNLLYIGNRSLPRSKHFPPRL
jgi:hypothetical protein